MFASSSLAEPFWTVFWLAAGLIGWVSALRATGGPLRPMPRIPMNSPPAEDEERRQSPRRKGNLVTVRIADAAATEWGSGRVVDRSDGGLCLLLDHPLEVGGVMGIRAVHAPRQAPWIQVEVKSCRRVGARWEAGCQFVTPPGWSDRVLFG